MAEVLQFFNTFSAQACVDEIARFGGCTVPNFLEEETRLMLLNELESYKFVPQPERYGDFNVEQHFDAIRVFKPGSLFVRLQKELDLCFNRQFGELDSPVLSQPVNFNDLVVQRYSRHELGISAHRDNKNYINLIALIVLEGGGRFCFCKDRSGLDAVSMRNRPGDLLLMRGPGFMGEDIRPFHFVDRITERRTTFALRQSK
jgi:hypothetical protein